MVFLERWTLITHFFSSKGQVQERNSPMSTAWDLSSYEEHKTGWKEYQLIASGEYQKHVRWLRTTLSILRNLHIARITDSGEQLPSHLEQYCQREPWGLCHCSGQWAITDQETHSHHHFCAHKILRGLQSQPSEKNEDCSFNTLSQTLLRAVQVKKKTNHHHTQKKHQHKPRSSW